MRRLLLVAALVLAAAPAAHAKSGSHVLVLGPAKVALVEPPSVFRQVMGLRLELVAPPHERYVLAVPTMSDGLPARPGRWYPASHTYCSGWRSGVEAGCAVAPALAGFLGNGSRTGMFAHEPVRIVALRRGGAPLPVNDNRTWAIATALQQPGRRAARPAECTAFSARWSAAGRPASLCVAPSGGVYAGGKLYPLPPRTAASITSF
jgi:hypothetical protein